MPFPLVYSIEAYFTSTGIEDVRTATQRDAAAYNLAGQRVGENHQGLVIIGGKKYIRK
jgi:hypothetical protein